VSPPAIALYDVVLFVHVIAVVAGFGVIFTYPMITAMAERRGAADRAFLFRMQNKVGDRMIIPSLVVIILAGIYLTIDRWDFGEPWIGATLLIALLLGALGGVFFSPNERRLAELSEQEASTGEAPGPEYASRLTRLKFAQRAGMGLVTLAVFLMITKPGA